MKVKTTMINGPFVYLCFNQRDFDKVLKKLKINERWEYNIKGALATTHSLSSYNKNASIISISEVLQTKPVLEVLMTIVHECVHVWQNYQEWIGDNLIGGEIEAYAIDSLSTLCINACCKHLNKNLIWRNNE